MELLLPHVGLIVWTTLSFLIVFFILKKFAWKQILNGLNERETNIANAIASAEKVKKEMAQLKSDNESLLASAREERTKMLKEAKDMKDKMINDAKEEAKNQAAKIIAEHQQHALALGGETGGEVDGSGGLAHATLLVRHGDDFGRHAAI